MYWFIAFDCDGELPAQSSDEIKEAAAALVQGWDHGIEECVKNTPADKISRSRFFDKWPLPTPAVQSGSFTLCGDALHPMTPNLGQVRSFICSLADTSASCRRLTVSPRLLKPVAPGREHSLCVLPE